MTNINYESDGEKSKLAQLSLKGPPGNGLLRPAEKQLLSGINLDSGGAQ